MATINQGKLDDMSRSMNNALKQLSSGVTSKIVEAKNKIEEIWISKASADFASDVKKALDEATKSITETINGVNKTLTANVHNHNEANKESVTYTKLSYDNFDTSPLGSISQTFSDGSIGLKDGHKISEIGNIVTNLVNEISTKISVVAQATQNCGVFDGQEATQLTNAFSKISTSTKNAMQKIIDSLDTRVSSEDNNYANVAKTNTSNLNIG